MSAIVSNVKTNVFPDNFYQFTVYSRVILIFVQIIFNHVVPDHKSDGFVSQLHRIPVNNFTLLDNLVNFFFGGYARWDGQYFLHVSVLGYTHENCLAFFPFFPLLNGAMAQFVSLVTFSQLTPWNSALLSSVILNNVFFVFAAKSLYQITLLLGADRRFAHQTWLLFCFSPATVFFTAPYSESLFSALTFGGLYHCLKGQFFRASLFFAFSASTRSNGLLNVGYLLFFAGIVIWRKKLKEGLFFIIFIILPSVITVPLPFLMYQYYAFRRFCSTFQQDHPPSVIHDFLLAENLTVPGVKIPSWCHQTLPFSYSAVQSDYWNVGFMRYFEWKQIPNFILASPVLVLVSIYFIIFVKNLISKSSTLDHPIFRWEAAAFAAHTMFLALFTFFFAHVQISTRLLGSSSPVLYWIMAWLSNERPKKQGKPDHYPITLTRRGKWVYGYCLSYVIIGTLLFVNHFPWT